MQTIVALATPPGNSGVAVIRMSGERARSILSELIRDKSELTARKMYLKNVYIGEIVDNCLVVYFHAPNSYTGEDVVEIQSHGGYFLAQKIIDECIRLGAQVADRGEFSKRAFINGKLSLDQAEGIMDLINAESEMQAQAGSTLMQGRLREKIQAYQRELTDSLADIEAKLDYPEYEYTASESADIKGKIEQIVSNLHTLIDDSTVGLVIKNGVKVALVGAPNVGKSSLLNALTKTNRAIVTAVAGTTRDVIEAEYTYNGIIFRLFDTAGIHESTDEVELIGIDRARQALADADIVLRVSDDQSRCEIQTDKPYIDVYNKSDKLSKVEKASHEEANSINVSARTGENIDQLKQMIFERTISGSVNTNKFYLTNTRHITAVKEALSHLENALKIFDTTSMDILSSELKQAWQSLGEITGETNNEAIIDRIFEKFCLGK